MDDFNFFLKTAKPMILNLPNAKDRATAALWLKKLCEVNSHSSGMTSDNNICVEFLKLLLLVMQGNQLTGVFEKPPPTGDLHHLLLPGQTKAKDMLSLVKRRKTMEMAEKSVTNGHPRVVTSIGGDMCEYVAVQEIPNFGIHGYYALSTEPLSKWSNPRDSASLEGKVSTSCFKNTCESLGIDVRDSDSIDENEKNFDERAKNNESTENSTKAEAGRSSAEENLRKKHEKMKHSEKSLQKIFQAQRSEIAGVETRPCWGRSRYIERLIDESPHLVGDLDLSQADALLHHYRDKKFRKIKSDGKSDTRSKICAISSRRRMVEKRLDMPPCASILVEDEHFQDDEETSEIDGSRTCVPRNFDLGLSRIIDQDENLGSYHSENEDFYPDDPIEAGQSNLEEYNTSNCSCMDNKCVSELVERTDYDDWQNYSHESGAYVDEFSRTTNHGDSFIFDPTMTTDDSDVYREMRHLIADPNRREPPSRGRTKAPRRKELKLPIAEQNHSPIEAWDPPVHSTVIDN